MSENQANGQVVCSRFQDGGKGLGKTGWEKIRENRVGAGERQSSEDLFLVYPMIGQLWQFTSTLLRQSLASGTQSLANMNMSSMSNPWRFDICFSESGLGRQIEVFKKTLTGSSPSLLPPFFARSLFHCSLGFFARLHWRRSARASLQIFCLTTRAWLERKNTEWFAV